MQQPTPVKQNNTLVMKFGGTSVGSVDAYRQVISIVRDAQKDWQHVVVVISAMSGITDLLLESALHASQGNELHCNRTADTLQQRHVQVLQALVEDVNLYTRTLQNIQRLIDDFSIFCRAIGVLGEVTPRALDTVISLGERMNVRLLSSILQAAGISAEFVESTRLILTDEQFQTARPQMPETRQHTREVILPLLDEGIVPVITGFIGATKGGVTTTLGRGGSDYSAAIMGICLDAKEVWVWTDVDGVMTADPRMVKDAHSLPELTYAEVAEMANFGAKVLHPKTIHPIVEANIGLRVCNTFNPQHPGTHILSNQYLVNNGKLKAVATIDKLRLITIKGSGMLGVPGVAARILSAVATTRASVPLIAEASSEQSICFAISMDLADQAIRAIQKEMDAELKNKDIDEISATDEIAIVTLVGPGMRNTVGIAGKVFMTLAQEQINVISISYGSSDLSLSLVVLEKDMQRTINALHTLVC
jgi:aspartate kinase